MHEKLLMFMLFPIRFGMKLAFISVFCIVLTSLCLSVWCNFYDWNAIFFHFLLEEDDPMMVVGWPVIRIYLMYFGSIKASMSGYEHSVTVNAKWSILTFVKGASNIRDLFSQVENKLDILYYTNPGDREIHNFLWRSKMSEQK